MMQRKISFKNDGKYNTSEMCDISKKRLVFFRKKDQSRGIIINKSLRERMVLIVRDKL